ncbi:RNA-directed DNA polymerase, eukaryota [Tanacetum coccineum]
MSTRSWFSHLQQASSLFQNEERGDLLHVDGTVFWVRAKEVSGWIPDFVEEEEDDNDSEDEIRKEDSEAKNDDNLNYEDAAVDSEVEEETRSEDPFNIYDLLNKKKENILGDTNSNNTMKYPPGFTPLNTPDDHPSQFTTKEKGGVERSQNVQEDKQDSQTRKSHPNDNSKEDIVEFICSGHFKTPELPRTGGSVLQVMKDLVKVGQIMGYNMEGFLNNIEEIIGSQGAREWILKSKLIIIISIYAPKELFEKKISWEYLIYVIGNWNGDVVIMGDFNEVRTQKERYGSVFNVKGAKAFNSFISVAGLEEFEMEGFDTFVERTWNEAQVIDSNDILKFSKKLKYLKDKTRVRVKSKKDISNHHKKTLKAEIADIDLLIDKGEGDPEVLNKRLFVTKSLHDIEKLASMEVTQKTKIKWEIEGDENSKYFHGILNKKRSQLAIRGILVDVEAPRLQVNLEFPNKLNLDQQFDLEREVSRDEIKRAVWDCGTDKSPGPDGFTFGFYRRYSRFLEKDMRYFFHNGAFSKSGNSSFIALIPKTPNTNKVKDFRPITLIGSLYKIITKILANRLVDVLADIVNEVQSAFVANRQILDGPFILNEVYHWCKKKKKQTMIFKVDFEKAYDSVRWDYLDAVLLNFGFGDRWRGWIQSCLNSSKGSVIVNGSPTNEFLFQRDLKQGDPLSPFLFILIMESLYISFQRVVDTGMFSGIAMGTSWQLSHLFYADDAVFMGQWSDSNIDIIVKVLECFYRASGLRINLNKSKLIGISVANNVIYQAANNIGCTMLTAPFCYLGSKVVDFISHTRAWDDILNKLSTRLSKWKMNTLSIGGRLTLLKSVLGSMPIYHMSLFKVPVKANLNGVDPNGKRPIWVKWNKVLAPKQKGGLGIHGEDGKLNTIASYNHSSIWLNIVREMMHLTDNGLDLCGFIQKKMGNGLDTFFWQDVWRGDEVIKSTYPRIYALEIQKILLLRRRCLIYAGQVVLVVRWIGFNISRRGMEIDSILCPFCDAAVESTSHIFFKCNIAKELAQLDSVIDKGEGDDDVINKRTNIVRSLQELEKFQSLETAQKAKIKWAIEGDENSKYYHVMSFPHPIIILSDSDVEDTFTSTHSPDYIPPSPNYFSASPGNTSSNFLNDLTKDLLASLALSPFYDDPYMKVVQAFNATDNELPILPQALIAPPTILTPSLVLSLSLMFDFPTFLSSREDFTT